MQELCSEIWPAGGRLHVGELAWGRLQHVGREPEWPTAFWWRGERLGIGLLEPVGVRPEYQRLGHGRAVCLGAPYALREAGLGMARVDARSDAAYPDPSDCTRVSVSARRRA